MWPLASLLAYFTSTYITNPQYIFIIFVVSIFWRKLKNLKLLILFPVLFLHKDLFPYCIIPLQLEEFPLTFPIVQVCCRHTLSAFYYCGKIYTNSSSNGRFWIVALKTLQNSLHCKDSKSVNPKGNQTWILIGRTDAEANTLTTWCEELTHWKRPWCWERFKVGGKGTVKGWDAWMASPTRWTWVWANSASCWWTGKPGVLQSMWLQRIRHNWATELNWTKSKLIVNVSWIDEENWYNLSFWYKDVGNMV